MGSTLLFGRRLGWQRQGPQGRAGVVSGRPAGRRLRLEPLEERRLLSLGTAPPTLPGMHLADPSVDRFHGQIVYLDFDGQQNVTYHGPVTVEGIDVPAFGLPGALAGREAAVIAELVDQVEGVFGDCGITVTTEAPAGGAYSTVYIGGDGSAFEQYGSFLGLAEHVDAGNKDPGDSAFVFSDLVLAGRGSAALADVTVHEIAHLLGYVHDCDDPASTSDLASVAHKGPTHKFITEQAYYLYKALFGVSGVELELDTFVNNDDWTDYCGDGNSICEGAVEEDLPTLDDLTPFCEHFCAGADRTGDYDELEVGLGENDSAFTRATGHYATAKDKYSTERDSAYWWFGSTVHLLQDMCVPAHVHNDPHAGIVGGDDEYENEVYDYKNSFTFDPANGTSWEFQDWDQGTFHWSQADHSTIMGSSSQALWDRSDDYNSLEALFRETTDYTDDYDSDNDDGDCHNAQDDFSWFRLAQLKRSADYLWHSERAIEDVIHGPWYEPDLTADEVQLVAHDLGTWAVEQSAMMMRFFYYDLGKVVSSPTDLQADRDPSQRNIVNLTWQSVDGADGYVVFRMSDKDTRFSRVGSPLVTNYEETGLDPDSEYYYRVYAYNGVAGLGSGYSSACTVQYVVSISTDEDDGNDSPDDLSLREALRLANSHPGKDVIRFTAELAGAEIMLDADLGQLQITSDLELMGMGVTIDANGQCRVFDVTGEVTDATIRDLTITRGRSSDNGGGIINQGRLHLVNSTISGNSAMDHGGGIYNRGTLSVVSSTIDNNIADEDSSAFGQGGGIYNSGTLWVVNSTISGNSTPWYSGGIHIHDTGSATVVNSTISGNFANGDGGGIRNYGQLSVWNSTIAQNIADVNGSGTGTGGGVHTAPAGNTWLHNTIVVGNVRGTGANQKPDDLWGNVHSASSYNLVGDEATTGGLNNGENGNIVGVDDLSWLLPLGNSGGPTQTHALLPDGPAINAGNNDKAGYWDGAQWVDLTTDQRGGDFVRVFSGAVDIGAFESQVLVVSTLADEDDQDHSLGDLSLREALRLAEEHAGPDEIRFLPDLAGGKIELAATLEITSNLDLLGRGVTIDALNSRRALKVTDAVTGATIRDLTITRGSADQGAGILNEGTLSVISSTVSGNSATNYGGGISNRGTLWVTNSTISGNFADKSGGGIFSSTKTLCVVNSTIADNTADADNDGDGGGGGVRSALTTTLHNTIVAENYKHTGEQKTSSDLEGDHGGTDQDVSSHNLVGDDSTAGGLKDGENGNIVGHDPKLEPLGDYGGWTQTRALWPDSPAIDAGDDDRAVTPEGMPLTSDQRGESFARFFDTVDMGAFERGPFVVSTLEDTVDGDHRLGNLSLREALGLAESIPGKDVIRFASELAGGEITLAHDDDDDGIAEELQITSDLDLLGSGVTIDANKQCRVLIVTDAVTDATIRDLTITGGSAVDNGGGILNQGTLSVINSTISGNSANHFGGGICSDATLEVHNSTVAYNTADADGGGIATSDGGSTTLHNTIVANNKKSTALNDLSGAVETDSSYNLVRIKGDSGLTTANGNILDLDPSLAPLGDYGGLTQTHALLPASPAIDAGDPDFNPNDFDPPLVTDQRGEGFPRVFVGADSNRLDIGAFEFQLIVSTSTDENDGDYTWGDLSLREALALAEQRPGKDVIQFAPHLAGDTITLALGRLEIKSDLDLVGMGVTIDANGKSRVFDLPDNATKATIRDLTITGGNFDDAYGGGIINHGTLHLVNSTISQNWACYGGGGIYNASTGQLTVENSTISNNSTDNDGGGIYNDTTGVLTVVNSTISGNEAKLDGGGVFNKGKLTLRQSTIDKNVSDVNTDGSGTGAGIFNHEGGELRVVSSTISRNSTTWYAGGIHVDADSTAWVVNSTISDNSAHGDGGGIRNYGTLDVKNSTIAKNVANENDVGGHLGGGVYTATGGVTTLHNTIVADNVRGSSNQEPNDLWGNVGSDSSYNLVGDAATTGGLNNGENGNIVGVEDLSWLPPLGNNGGPTQTHALLPGSLAVDAGDPLFNPDAFDPPLVNDQRGEGFDRISGQCVDIGAFELQQNQPPVLEMNTGIILDEGATEVIDNTELLVTDAEQSADALTYTIETNVTHGTLELAGSGTLGQGATFTQADVDAGRLSYTHDGGKGSADSFVFSASDGEGGTIENTPFVITINNVAPTLTLDPVAAVDENSSATLTGTITDPGTLDTFTLVVNWGDGSAAETFSYPADTTTFSQTHPYLDDDPSGTASDEYTITVRVEDDDTGSDTQTTPVTVTNVAPVLSDLSATDVDESGTSTLSGTITDPGTLDTFTLVVNWGDGSAEETFYYPAGTTTFSETHKHLDDDPSGTASDEYTITVRVEDDDTGSDTETTSVTVSNVAPVLSDLSATDVDESGTSTLSGTITDPGTLDTFTLVVNWGDGSAEETFSYPAGTTEFSETHAYLDDDPSGTPSDEYTITVTVEDDDTGSDTQTTPVTVTNVAPVFSDLSATDVDESGTSTLSGTITDPGTLDTFTLVVDWGDGSAAEEFSYPAGTTQFSETHAYLDDDPSGTPSDEYTITVTVEDDDTGSDTETTTVTVTNVAPVLSDVSATDVDENGTSTLTGTITDPGTLDTFTLVVNWGDGSAEETFSYPAGTTQFSETHQYLDDDPSGTASDEYTITFRVEDDDTGSDTQTTPVTVTNVAPVLSDVSATDVDESGTSTLSGTITDPGTLDTFTLVVDWGDGSAAEEFSYPSGTTQFSETHAYLDDDPSGTPSDEYTITVTLEDDDTGSDTQTTSVAVWKAAAIQASLRDADTSLPADPGEADAVPESLPWIDEWDSFWVEIWGNTPDTTGYGVGSFSVDLVYNTDLFTATTIQYGPAFTEDQTGTIDDAAGRVDQIAASTTQTDVGAERNVLLARVFFEPMSCDAGCAHNADGQYVTPVEDLGLAFEEAGVELVGVGQSTVELGASPDTDSWPVIYDVDDDGQVGFGDLAFFATAFQQTVGDPEADFAWACDFDHSGKVDVGDLAFFAENFQRAAGSPIVYPGNFPDDWQTGTQQAAAMQAPPAAMQALAAAEGLRAPDPAFLSACCLWDFDTLEAASANSSDSKEVEAVDFLIAHGYW